MGDIDLSDYLSVYQGYLKYSRALYIADNHPALRSEAVRIGSEHAKAIGNFDAYLEILKKYGEETGIRIDEEWVSQQGKKSHKEKEALELALVNAKQNVNKKETRAANIGLAEYFQGRADFSSAMKALVRVRDFNSSQDDVLDMCIRIIEVCVQSGSFQHLTTYVSKAEATPVLVQAAKANEQKELRSMLKCAHALTLLMSKRFRGSARTFLESPEELSAQYAHLMVPRDVALATVLCALAEFDRSELKRRVLENSSFHDTLDSNPELRELALDLYHSRYGSLFDRMDQKIKPLVDLDPYTEPYWTLLKSNIRERALVQYLTPFSSVRLSDMATAFNSTVDALEQELTELIGAKKVHVRIDAHNKLLFKKKENLRADTVQHVLDYGRHQEQESNELLLRLSLLSNDLIKKERSFDVASGGGDWDANDFMGGSSFSGPYHRGGGARSGAGGGGSSSKYRQKKSRRGY